MGRMGNFVILRKRYINVLSIAFYQFRLKTVSLEVEVMGALVAAVDKKGQNVVPSVVSMLNELRHRGKDGHGVATADSVTIAKTIEELSIDSAGSGVVLGHNLSRTLPRDHPQPIQGDGFTFVFEGRLFPSPNLQELPEPEQLAITLSSSPMRNASHILESMEGSYVFAVAESDRIVAGRDVFGAVPLYYGENGSVCALASERKALWKLGLDDVKSFPPGHLAVVDAHGFSFSPVKALHMPPIKRVSLETAAQALHLLLLGSTRKRVSDLDEVAVAFSGGVDSSVVAALAKDAGLEVQLVAVGLEDQPEVMFAQEAAEALELPLHFQTYTVDELEATLAKALWLTEESGLVGACVAVPFYWTAEAASKLGYPVLLAGQGADELFGGYKRYLTEYARSGDEAVREIMFRDVVNAYSDNFQRDNQVCAYHGVELRLPFIDCDVVDFALRLPLRLKLNSAEDLLRKRVLRRVARNLDIPDFIADKPKKAIQYTTGVTKAIKRKAKTEGLTLREYITEIYNKTYPTQ
ncbi:asparagine synthetase B [Candidatus Bathyarchaeota archaeon]|nr:asparagine synthetase B [Candidatus Bathyarchaeota archaeon]